MAIWECTVEKQMGQEFWTNVYHFQAADLALASNIGDSIADIEVAAHYNSVTVTAYRVSDTTPGSGVFTTIPRGQSGANILASDYLPLWNVARVDFTVSGRRACRKFLRLPIPEGEQSAGGLSVQLRNGILQNYANPLAALGVLTNPQGDPILDGIVMPMVAMRQLKRGSKRKITTGP